MMLYYKVVVAVQEQFFVSRLTVFCALWVAVDEEVSKTSASSQKALKIKEK